MRFQSIDMLRGAAATSVVLAHVDPRFSLGAIGVDIFFVISGLVMATLSARSRPAEFLADRAMRIYPLYWAVAAPWIAIGMLIGAATPALAVSSLLLWPQWLGIDSSFIGVSWTLVYELMFYLAVAASIKLRSPAIPLVLFAFALVARPFSQNALIAFAGHPIAVEFLLGVLIARAPRGEGAAYVAALAALVWIALFPNAQLHDILGNQSTAYGVERLLLWGVPSALLVYGLFALEGRFSRRWTSPFLAIGAASYSIYLVHSLVTALLAQHWVVEFAVAMAAGICLWRYVERPILAHRARIRKLRVGEPVSAETIAVGRLQAAAVSSIDAVSVAAMVPPPSRRSPS